MTTEAHRLIDGLDRQRDHARGIREGLSDDHMCQTMLPSGWSCVGRVRHRAAAEHHWFRTIVAGEPSDNVEADQDASGDPWRPSNPVPDIFAVHRAETEAANAIIAATPLDQAPRGHNQWMEALRGAISASLC